MKKLKLAAFLAAFFFCLPCRAESDPAPVISAPTVRVLCGGKARDAQILSDPQKGTGLFFYGGWAWRRVWFDQKALQSLEDSAQKYIGLFNARKLKKGASKQSLAAFKSAQVIAEWGSTRDSLDKSAPAKARFGYDFIENSPYFSITIPSVQSQPAASPSAGKAPASALQISSQTAVFLTQKNLLFLLDTGKKTR